MHLKDALPDLKDQYKKRDILRLRGNLVQLVIVGVSRGGWIHVSPTLYVLGSEPNENFIHQTVGLDTKQPQAWKFPPETLLDASFSNEIADRLAHDVPISFTQPLSDEAISRGLCWFGKDGLHWAADLFLAFFNMTRGATSARKDLAHAFELFRRNSRLSTDKPLRDWEEALLTRFNELEARLDRPDCIALCRADAEAHAGLLKLPAIVWPPEWPEAVPPWPKEKPSGWLNKLLG